MKKWAKSWTIKFRTVINCVGNKLYFNCCVYGEGYRVTRIMETKLTSESDMGGLCWYSVQAHLGMSKFCRYEGAGQGSPASLENVLSLKSEAYPNYPSLKLLRVFWTAFTTIEIEFLLNVATVGLKCSALKCYNKKFQSYWCKTKKMWFSQPRY